MKTVEVYSANSTTEVHLLRGLLAQHDIDSDVSGHYLQGAFGELPMVNMIQLLVEPEDESAARTIIERFERGEFALDDEA